MTKSNILGVTVEGISTPPPSITGTSGEVILKSLDVTPQTVQIGQPVTVTATYVNGLGQPISGLTVYIEVSSPISYPAVGQQFTLKTDSNGQVTATYPDTIISGTWAVSVWHAIFNAGFSSIDGTASFTVEGTGIFLYTGDVTLGYYGSYWAATVSTLFRASTGSENITGVATVTDSLGSSQTIDVTPFVDVIFLYFEYPSLPSGYTVKVTIQALGLTKTYTFVFNKIVNLAKLYVDPFKTYYVYG